MENYYFLLGERPPYMLEKKRSLISVSHDPFISTRCCLSLAYSLEFSFRFFSVHLINMDTPLVMKESLEMSFTFSDLHFFISTLFKNSKSAEDLTALQPQMKSFQINRQLKNVKLQA